MRLELSQTPRQYQQMRLRQEMELRTRFEQHAVRAFKRYASADGKMFYTCNVARMRKCNRLGTRKQVTLWRSHVFLQSPKFGNVDAVIFSENPGEELSAFARNVVEDVYVLLPDRRIIDPTTGEELHLDSFPKFAPLDSPKDDPDIHFGDEYLKDEDEEALA